MSHPKVPYVNLAEAKARLSELVEKAATGEEIVIAKDHKPIARLTSLGPASSTRTPGSARGRLWVAPDFDETPADFGDYLP